MSVRYNFIVMLIYYIDTPVFTHCVTIISSLYNNGEYTLNSVGKVLIGGICAQYNREWERQYQNIW